MLSIEQQILEYRKQQRGEYRLAKHEYRHPLGAPYAPNRVVVVGHDFAQLLREIEGDSEEIPDAPHESVLNAEATYSISSVQETVHKKHLARARRRITETRRLQWGLKK
jgi:hypothetical protein